jgi:hypothetical protein
MFDIDVKLDIRAKRITKRIMNRLDITQSTYTIWPCGLVKEIIISSNIKINVEEQINIFVNDLLIVSSENPKQEEILNVIELAK